MSSQAFDADQSVEKLSRLAQQFRGAAAGGPRDKLTGQYRTELNQLLAAGWPGALGAANELPDNLLPPRYLEQRAQVIERLEISLADWASKYRANPKGSRENADAIKAYHQVFAELLRVVGKVIALDADAELLDADMPKAYVDHWL